MRNAQAHRASKLNRVDPSHARRVTVAYRRMMATRGER